MSLDAPLVAIIWQGWWAKATHTSLPTVNVLILGLGVWLIYLADRLADIASALPDEPLSSRHAFHARWRILLSVLASSVGVTLIFLTLHVLTSAEFSGGMILLAFAGAYFWLIHGSRQSSWTKYLPKEMAVGGIFAVGTAFFPVCLRSVSDPGIWVGVALFGVSCFCNCALITTWERQARDLRDPSSLLNAFSRLTARLGAICVTVACLAVMGGMLSPKPSSFFPIILSGVFLALLDRHRHRFSLDGLRVLADAALLTPLLTWSVMKFPLLSIYLHR